MLKVEILGGVGEYGRNCFYIEHEGHAILLDCGVMNNAKKHLPDLTQAHVAKLRAVFISHSHIDHVGALPMLENLGYSGGIIMSKMTAKQLKETYKNTIKIQPETINKWLKINDSLEFQWGYSGHIVGSVWYKIRFFEKKIFFSGDYVMDSYLLNANFDKEDGSIYDLAFIDSGHIEKRIDNLNILEQIKDYINENSTHPIIFPASFSGKTADIATYIFHHTIREVNIDEAFYTFFEDYYDSPENILPTMYEEVLRPFKRECLRKKVESENAIYFVPEFDEWRIKRLLQDKPNAKVILTGYLKKAYLTKLMENESRSTHFFYKTHLDRNDIEEFSEKINALEIIYFHSRYTNMKIEEAGIR